MRILPAMQKIELLKERTVQDYRSTYNDIRDWLRREKSGKNQKNQKLIGMMLCLRLTY
jgi:type I restriction enzyme, R subunit